MQLEDIEREAIEHLATVSNPLVPLESLVAHLNDRGALGSMDRDAVLKFIESHDRIKLMDPPGGDAAADVFGSDPFVILDTRVPSAKEITIAFAAQLDTIASALVSAAKEAKAKNDSERLEKIESLLKRLDRVRGILAASA